MIVVTSPDILPKELGNISFSQSAELDLGNVLKTNTEYTIRVQLVENTSGTTIDERNTTIMYTAAHELCKVLLSVTVNKNVMMQVPLRQLVMQVQIRLFQQWGWVLLEEWW